MQRTLITLIALTVGLAFAVALVMNSRPSGSPQDATPTDGGTTLATGAADTPPSPNGVVTASPVEPIAGLHVVPVTEQQPEPVIGGTNDDPANPHRLEAKLSPWGAGLIHVKLAGYYQSVEDKQPYLIQERVTASVPGGGQATVYPMSIDAIIVNGVDVPVNAVRWRVIPEETDGSRVTFELTLADDADKPVVRVRRVASATAKRYDVRFEHRIENLTDKPLRVAIRQYGPADLPEKKSYMGDRRHVTMGYFDPGYDPSRRHVFIKGFDHLRHSVIADDEGEYDALWPTDKSREDGYELTWAAMGNRYFAAAVHAVVPPSPTVEGQATPALKAPALEQWVGSVTAQKWGVGDEESRRLAIMLHGKPIDLAPAGDSRSAASWDLSLYAGPKERAVLINPADFPEYDALGLRHLIIYNLGGMCAVCTFAWLAELMIMFLKFMHFLTRDWGMAIIGLVVVVRGLLHPLTKNSQINMMKVSKQMQALQPEVERLKKKYAGKDQSKLNQEMMALYRERGVNPAAMGMGCLPMFLQMPIWIALYAVLFYAIELRHQPAFWGVFQGVSGSVWPFLSDLSSPDRLFDLPWGGFTIPFIGYDVTALNVLPILLGVTFYLQQKYMTAPAQSKEIAQQQAIMKWMVMLFPVFLYPAPSGLNLYILASTATGIVESKRVRKHIADEEAKGTLLTPKEQKKGGCLGGGLMQRVAEAAEQQQRKLEQQKGGSGGGGRTRGGRNRGR